MAFISAISGLRVENLASAILAHLLLRSEPIRQAFIAQVSPLSKQGPIIVNKHFAVFTEVTTEERKRVDILVQTDNAIVGVENKFSADFQVGQPKSYLGLVEDKANLLSKVWNTTFQPLLVVLAPKDRKTETEDKIKQQGIGASCAFLSWEDVLSGFSRNSLPDLSPVDRFLVDELTQYANSYMGTIDLSRLMDHLDDPWQRRGSSVVKEVYNSVIWPLIGEDLRKHYSYAGGASYHGYYLYDETERRPWLGFMDRQYIEKNSSSGASLVVGLRLESAADSLCGKVNGVRIGVWETDGFYCVVVPYESSWVKRSNWRSTLDLINEALRMISGP